MFLPKREQAQKNDMWEVGPGKFLGIVGQDPSDSKSKWSHVDIFRGCFNLFEVYSIVSSKIIGNSPEVSNFNRYYFNSRSYFSQILFGLYIWLGSKWFIYFPLVYVFEGIYVRWLGGLDN